MWAYAVTKESLSKVSKIDFNKRLPSTGIELVDVPIPNLKPNEVLVKVQSSALNYNSIWSATCHPVSPFQLINNHIRRNPDDKEHAQDYAILGSDASGYVAKVGAQVKDLREGDEVIIHCNVADENDPQFKIDSMISSTQSIWGYETNFGAFAEFAKVKSSQLIKKPSDISWDVAGSFSLTLSTAYRMLLSDNGARLKKGETCLIWGAAGGLGSFAIQLCKLIGAKSIAVVSTNEKAKVAEDLGADYVINRKGENLLPFTKNGGEPDLLAWNKFSKLLKSNNCPEIDCVFEHVGAQTLGMSVYLVKRGGRVVICGASSGFISQIDLRYLWMELKTIYGSHFANEVEASIAAGLVFDGKIKPLIHSKNKISELPKMADKLHNDDISGKIVFNH